MKMKEQLGHPTYIRQKTYEDASMCMHEESHLETSTEWPSYGVIFDDSQTHDYSPMKKMPFPSRGHTTDCFGIFCFAGSS